mmetsp:Transcript_22533/g.48801  ORF Transcript_22533/g.48801 Transcript_22533/m.48801 type:complete len:580 (-) Transcript_22533:217-1956(-)
MPKTKRRTPSLEACVPVPTESPVPGVHIELASLLVQAIKARRKFLSKSSSSSTQGDDAEKESLRQSMLDTLQSTADDKTATFLNELRRKVELSSASGSKSFSRRNNSTSNAPTPTHCLEFLLEILSNGSNSFHLRRSGLALARGVLERSSDARTFLASGQCLLDFVSVVEGVDNDHVEEDGNNGDTSNTSPQMSPKSMFQLEALDLIHNLALKFGKFYTQFTVASRLLGDVSVNFSMNNSIGTSNNDNTQNGEGRSRHSRRINMRILRKERDIALECGPKACHSLERMIERADDYFRVLVPRFGGFNAESLIEHETSKYNIASSMPASESNGLDPIDTTANDVDHGEDDDDDSIDWEEGDIDLSDNDNHIENTNPTSTDFHDGITSDNPSSIDHQAAVAHTLDIMGRSGALLDGELAVQIIGGKSMEVESSAIHSAVETPADLATTTGKAADLNAEARLQNIVKKVSTRRLPRLNQWIHALSHADGMEERAVVEPAAVGVPGIEGPVSLVLLSEEKRALRGQLLQRMMKVRAEINGVLKSAAVLGIDLEEAENKNDGVGSTVRALESEGKKSSSKWNWS